MIQAGEVLDGYRILRRIGAGGFGEVWLCRSEALGDYRALKFVPIRDEDYLRKEFEALGRYRAAAGRLRSPAVMPIEHANMRPDGLYYVMPLADGIGTCADPSAAEWQPLTLAALIESRRTAPTWFSSAEIKSVMAPILHALQLLSEAGLVHRDVKPDNILFLGGTPCLADISLLGEDRVNLTRRGTPGYSAPSWYVESGGPFDMFGAATTLYAMLTGNPPDKLGRSTFRWPPQGEASLSAEERAEWLRLHAVIRRATDERGSERFADFVTMCRALTNEAVPGVVSPRSAPARLLIAIALMVLAAAGFAIWSKVSTHQTAPPSQSSPSESHSPPATPIPVITEPAGDDLPAAYREPVQQLKERLDAHLARLFRKPEEITAPVDTAVAALRVFRSKNHSSPEVAVGELETIHSEFARALDKLPRLPRIELDAAREEINGMLKKLEAIPQDTQGSASVTWKIDRIGGDTTQMIGTAIANDARVRYAQLERMQIELNTVYDQALRNRDETLLRAVNRFRDTSFKMEKSFDPKK